VTASKSQRGLLPTTFSGGEANCFIDVGAAVSKKVELSSNGDDDDSSDGDSRMSSRAVRV
jgi:hypothetical protein